MHPALLPYAAVLPHTGNLADGVDRAFAAHGMTITREHVPRVAELAVELARRFGHDEDAARTAALLHDIGGTVPRSQMVGLCRQLGLHASPEEESVPMLLHQRLSEMLAREHYGVTDAGVLQAIRYHTALHAAPTEFDQLIFLADKIEWDQGGEPPYRAGALAALDGGLEAATRVVLGWLYRERAQLKVVLPELRAAWRAFGIVGDAEEGISRQ